MAWKYPPNLIKGDYVVDSIAINENFLSVVEETSGYLNEHNFMLAKDFFLERPALAPGYSMKLYRSYGSAGSDANTIPAGATLPTGWVKVATTPGFQTFSDPGLTLSFTSRGGPTWVCGSFNLHNTSLGDGRLGRASSFASVGVAGVPVNDGTIIAIRKGMGFNCAIALDGSILNESLVGSGDATNDFYVDEDNTSTKVFPKGGGGIQGAANAIVVDAIVDLEPGPHTIRIAIENILSSNGRTPNKAAISSREIFALELTR